MSASKIGTSASKDAIAGFLGSIVAKGVVLWSENGRLRYKSPKGMLTQDEIHALRVSRDQILTILESGLESETAETRERLIRAPLAFSQLAHMHLHNLHMQGTDGHSIRLVASATRLLGRLKIDRLGQSLREVVHRHSSLRTRIMTLDGVHMQEVSESGGGELSVEDLRGVAERFREREIQARIDQFIMAPISLCEAPLFGVKLLRLSDSESVLIIAMDHMISDGTSLNIFERDLLTAYADLSNGRVSSLTEIPMQFSEYALDQRSKQISWIEQHGEYWRERLNGCGRVRFPPERKSLSHAGWGIVPLRIGKDVKKELLGWCRARRTTLVLSLFTAYAALICRWCDQYDVVIQYQSNGRVRSEIQDAIGFFASPLHLRIDIRRAEGFVGLLKRVADEYCMAYEHADLSYLAAQEPRPDFTRNTVFNWSPRGAKLGVAALSESHDPVRCIPIQFIHPMLRTLELDHEPEIALYDVGEEIAGEVYFPMSMFSSETMRRFVDNFYLFVRTMLVRPNGSVMDIQLV